MQTVLFAARLTRELSGGERKRLFACLPPERQARFRRGIARDEILCAYGLLCAALYTTLDWRELPPVALSERGKPYFPDFPGVCFSLSHTDGAVMAGVSPGPIGVDIERGRRVRARLMERVAGTDSPDAFFRYWVALEAVGKRGGEGVIGGLHGGGAPLSDMGYSAPDVWPGYYAGVACSPGHTPGAIRLYTV